jgi:hypothetical protein
MERLASEYRLNSRTKSPFVTEKQVAPFFREKKIPRFFFLFGIFVINLCYIIREISLFPPVYYPAPATININILEGN